MRRIVFFIMLIIPFIAGCDKDNSQDSHYPQVREIAWNALSSQEQSSVISDWKKAPVSVTIYQEKNAYAVTFSTEEDALLGPIVVYLDAITFIVLGHGLRA